MSKATKLTATFEGVTATRKSAHPYTHVVFGKKSGELQAQHVECSIADEQREQDLINEALEMVRAGVTPPKGHALLQVTSVNGYHRFTRWDNIALFTADHGRSFRPMSYDEAVAEAAKWARTNRAEWLVMMEERAAEYRAQGEQWIALSWHHSFALALKGAQASTVPSYIVQTQIVEVSK
jgi:hypothetical protein